MNIKALIAFGIGVAVGKYILTDKKKTAAIGADVEQQLDRIRNNMHDFLKDKFPEIGDAEIGERVSEITELK